MIDDVRGLYEYIRRNRGVGHTTLLIEGAKNYNKPFYIMGANIRQAKDLVFQSGNKNARPITLENVPEALRGTDLPIMVDQHPITKIVDGYEDEIRMLRREIGELRGEISQLWIDRHVVDRRLDYARKEINSLKHKIIRVRTKHQQFIDEVSKFTFGERLIGFENRIKRLKQHHDYLIGYKSWIK